MVLVLVVVLVLVETGSVWVLVTAVVVLVVVVVDGTLVVVVVEMLVEDVELVVDAEPLQSMLPCVIAPIDPPTDIWSFRRTPFCNVPWTPHPVPYDFAVWTELQPLAFITCNAVMNVTAGKANTLVACSSESAWTG